MNKNPIPKFLLLLISYILFLTSLNADFIRDGSKEVVLDTKTNLMWQDNIDTKTITKNWSDAIDYCENLTLGGYSDWYLPNINELRSLTSKNYDPAIDPAFKNVVSDIYWSSTTKESCTCMAWDVDFEDGYAANGEEFVKSDPYYVRCVRHSDN